MTINIRKSVPSDLEKLMVIYREARQIQIDSGNLHQWEEGYPSEDIVRHDIDCGYSHIVEYDGAAVGAFSFIPGDDPTYKVIYDGSWIDDDRPYSTIHRLGSLKNARGVASACFDWCWKQTHNLRVDTHEDNVIMRHCLEKAGFKYCGIIHLMDGRSRIAFQKVDLGGSSKSMELFKRYLVSTAGIFLVAFAISLMVCCNLGISTLSGPAYVLTQHFTGSFTLGQYTTMVNMLFIVIQLAVLRRQFKLRYLLQIIASIIFGYFIDASNFMLSWLTPVHLGDRFALLLVSCFISALGVSMEVKSDAWMLSAEMTANSIAIVGKFKFRNVKVIMDCTILAITVVLCLIYFGNPLCASQFSNLWDALTAKTPGTVVGLGTIVASILIGLLMRFTDPFVEKYICRFLHK